MSKKLHKPIEMLLTILLFKDLSNLSASHHFFVKFLKLFVLLLSVGWNSVVGVCGACFAKRSKVSVANWGKYCQFVSKKVEMKTI